jgi:hypothetical protein
LHWLSNNLKTNARCDEWSDGFAETCATDLARSNLDDFVAKGSCAYIPPLACALRDVAEFSWKTADAFYAAQATYNRLFARVLAPALFAAQDNVVEGMKQSFQKALKPRRTSFSERAKRSMHRYHLCLLRVRCKR